MRTVSACRFRAVGNRTLPPRLRYSAGTPEKTLLDHLAVLRAPASRSDRLDRKRFDSAGDGTIVVFERYVRVVPGPRRTRIVLIPAENCILRSSGGHQLVEPEQVLLMQLLGSVFANDATAPPSIVVGTASQIIKRPALPGLDADNRAWMQTTVVPDGVTRVKMHFTPPFRAFYTRTLTVHDNVAAAFPLPAYTPTTTTWYNAAGRIIHRFVDHKALKYDNCLRHHRASCPG